MSKPGKYQCPDEQAMGYMDRLEKTLDKVHDPIEQAYIALWIRMNLFRKR